MILNQTKTKMYLVASRNITWDKDSNSSLFIWKETLGNSGRGMGKTGKRRRPIKSVLSNKSLLWPSGACLSLLPTPSLSLISHLSPHLKMYFSLGPPSSHTLRSHQSLRGLQLKIRPEATEINVNRVRHKRCPWLTEKPKVFEK